MIENFRSASEKLGSLAATLDEVAGQNAADINVTIDNLRATTGNARDFSETVADAPWRIFWRTRQPEKKAFDSKEAEFIER